MSQDVLPPDVPAHDNQCANDPPWADPWRHPEYYQSITLRRIIAYFIDATILAIIIFIAFSIAIFFSVMTFGITYPLFALIIFFIPVTYHTAMVGGSKPATLGMRIMGIRVMSIHPLHGTAPSAARLGRPSTAQAFAQVLLFYLSVAMTSCLILLICLFNPRRRTLHDWLSGTAIVNERPFNHSTQ